MSSYPTGTVVASPIIGGSSGDTYGTHYSYLGVGGWQEFQSINERNAIPIDALSNLDASGLGSGRRRLGMLVYVSQLDTVYQLFVPYTIWTGYTGTQKVSALANNSNWNIFSSGGGDAIKKKHLQSSHGFSAGNVISFNGTNYVKGIASAGNTYEFLGIVSKVFDPNNFELTYAGFIDLTSVTGLSANTLYFASPSIAGAITSIEPFNAGESSRPMVITQQSNKGLVLMERSFIVSNVGSSGSTSNGLRIQRTTSQTSHGFALGDVIRYSGSTYQKAIATQPISDFPIGIVSKVIDTNSFIVCFAGYVDGMSSAFDSTGTKHLSGSTLYYLSPSTAGKLTKVKPSSSNQIHKPIYQALTTDDGIVINQRGLPTFLPISGITGLQTALDSKINTSLIGASNGVVPLNSSSIIPLQYIPSGLKEEYVLPNISARTATFYVSGGTGTSQQVMSFRGLRVFILNAHGAPQLPSGYTGSSEFIDTTGFLHWSATTGNVYVTWNSVQNKPNFVYKITAASGLTATNGGTGNTTIGIITDNVYTQISSTKLTIKANSIDATRIKYQGNISGTTGQFLTKGTGTTFQMVSASASVIGPAEDGSYTDGIFTDFTPTTPVGTAVDRFNELFLLVLPQQPALLTNINGVGSFVSGNLSWGVSKNDISYTNVTTTAGNSAVDINGTYSISGTRLGITNTSITGTLNNNVTGDVSGIPYLDHAFQNGDQGKLVMFRNGTKITQLILSGTTASTSNTKLSVSAIQFVKAPNGSPVSSFKYRTGTYTIPLTAMTTGYNYIKIFHSGSTFSTQTNYLEFVYDTDVSNISVSSTGLTNLTLGGSKNISGVKYHTSGTIQYQATIANAYKNVYSSSATAINYVSRDNLGALTNLDISGTGISARTTSVLQTFPPLLTSVSNPQNTSITTLATLPISSTILLGNIGVLGRLRSGINILHPFTSQQLSGGTDIKTGFLLYNITQSNILNSEDFTGEVNRVHSRDYTILTYSNVNSGTYAWDSTQSLIGVSSFHNSGLLIFNDELIYPNATYLTTQYGITTGNFGAVTNSPASNVNYTSASGIRNHYRMFKSANGTTQSTLTFTIDHTGNASNFIVTGGTGGTASSNSVKLEFLIMRSGGLIHGWANPFALSGNPEGITNTSTAHVGSVTTVSCTLSTVPRVANGDIIIVRIFAASGFTNRIKTLSITNI